MGGFIVAREQYVQTVGGMKGLMCLGMAYSLRMGDEVGGRGEHAEIGRSWVPKGIKSIHRNIDFI